MSMGLSMRVSFRKFSTSLHEEERLGVIWISLFHLLGINELCLSRRLEGVYQGGALGMGHAKEVTRLVVRHQAIDGFVANDHALLVIELTCIWWHIAARHVHRLRVGYAGHQLGRLAYGDVSIGFVGHKVLGRAHAMDASLKREKKDATPMRIA